jgi:hypothetical protein
MKSITVNENEYKLEYSFEAAENKDCVQAMFKMVSGAYVAQKAVDTNGNEQSSANAMIDGITEMVADIPHVVNIAFYAGLLENNPLSRDEAKAVMRQYMKENKISYNGMYEVIRECMEDDGFFDLSGLNEMLKTLTDAATEKVQEIKAPKKTTKKSTSTN